MDIKKFANSKDVADFWRSVNLEFQNAIPNISKIILRREAFFGYRFVVVADLSGDDEVKIYPAHDTDIDESSWRYDLYQVISKGRFHSALEKLHIGEWKKTYIDRCVSDGVQWEIEIRYTDGNSYKIYGCNDYPYNFNEFLDLLDVRDLWKDDE